MTTHEITTHIITPPGHWGNLDATSQAALESLKKRVQERIGRAHPTASWYDELTLLRYLRACNFEVTRAAEQIAKTDAWRKEIDLESLFATAKPADLAQSVRNYPQFTGRRDLRGRPIFVFRLGSLTPERLQEIDNIDEAKRLERVAVLAEIGVRMYSPLMSYVLEQQHPVATPMDMPRVICTGVGIVDFDGASVATVWALRSYLKQIVALLSAHYPETLGALCLVNVSYVLGFILSWVHKWFDEGSRVKVIVITSQQLKDGKLLELIDKRDLPRIYAGELDWVYDDEPDCDAGIQAAIGSYRLPRGPAEWQDGKLIVYDEEERQMFPKAGAPSLIVQAARRRRMEQHEVMRHDGMPSMTSIKLVPGDGPSSTETTLVS